MQIAESEHRETQHGSSTGLTRGNDVRVVVGDDNHLSPTRDKGKELYD
jgi:hypothetical protein